MSTRRAQKLRAMRAKMLAKLQHQGELRGPWPFHLKRLAQMLVDQGRACWASPGVLAPAAPALPG